MVKHGMDVIMKATELVNPAQIPVLTLDQPLYTIAKQMQWAWPSIYGEEKYVVFMGKKWPYLMFLVIGWKKVIRLPLWLLLILQQRGGLMSF